MPIRFVTGAGENALHTPAYEEYVVMGDGAGAGDSDRDAHAICAFTYKSLDNSVTFRCCALPRRVWETDLWLPSLLAVDEGSNPATLTVSYDGIKYSTRALNVDTDRLPNTLRRLSVKDELAVQAKKSRTPVAFLTLAAPAAAGHLRAAVRGTHLLARRGAHDGGARPRRLPQPTTGAWRDL